MKQIRRTRNTAAVTILSLSTAGAARPATSQSNVIYANDFNAGLADFAVEQEKPARIVAADGTLTIDAPAGTTVWLKQKLVGPIVIEYDAVAIQAGGPNDRMSDLNCFWMASDPLHPADLFAAARTGKFADYDTLKTYYVGYGGNTNTTTRFRRYIGKAGDRPIRDQDNLTAADKLLKPNVSVHLKLVADGSFIEFYRDGERLFAYNDAEPYREGWFGWRTTQSHLEIRNLRISRLAR